MEFVLTKWFIIRIARRWVRNDWVFKIIPFQIHKHHPVLPYHFHFIIEIAFWYFEITIGKEEWN